MRAALALLLLAAPAMAQEGSETGKIGGTQDDAPPEVSPQPEPRPDPEDQLPPEEPMADDSGAVEADAETVGLGVFSELAEPDETFAACVADLEALGAVFSVVEEPIRADDPDCGIARPITVTEVIPGIAFAPAATVRCETALAAARWVSTHVEPASRAVGRGTLASLELGGSYQCRRRNNAATGKLSEHSFGNALDVMAFTFTEGDPIRVEPREDEGTLAEAFQRSARATSCLHFTTVLGPGTDATREDHLHMDVKARRGDYRICQ